MGILGWCCCRITMSYNPERHHRRSMRLSGHDYSSAGFYFITTCVHQRQCLFGDIAAGQMQLNELGKIVDHEWQRSQQIRPEFKFHEWVVMPNHFHAIIEIPTAPVRTTRRSSSSLAPHRSSSQISNRPQKFSQQPTAETINLQNPSNQDFIKQTIVPVQPSMRPKSISSLMAGFKSTTARQINQIRQAPGTSVWQRRFYDHIIRNEIALQTIRRYIVSNPANWSRDRLYL